MEITLIILAVLQAATLGILVAIFRQRAIDQTLTKVYTNTDALQKALEAHKESIEGLPTQIHSLVASEVKSGLEPLVTSFDQLRNDTSQTYAQMADKLVETHGAFVEMLKHVSHFDTMPSWLNRIEQSVKPLQVVGEHVMKMQEQNKIIFKDANLLIADYKEKGDSVYNSYALLTDKIDEWLGEERKSRHNFAESVDDHLRQFNSLNQKINNMLGDFKSFTDHTKNLFDDLDKNIPKAVLALTKAGEGHREIEVKLDKALEKIHRFSEQIADETKHAVQQQNDLKENMNEFLKKFQKKLDRGPWWKRLFS